MKRIVFLIIICFTLVLIACKKEGSERFRLLTAHAWSSDSLLAEGVDASGSGQVLEKFKGDAMFYKDHTGYFGKYTGSWRFAYNETNIVIQSDSLQMPITANIDLLSNSAFKITTAYPNKLNPSNPIDIRMTFKAK